jgi:alpha-beta hydrolase superfamily lysophospholipase
MSLLRSFAFRAGVPIQPLRVAADAADLTTRAERESGTLAKDALHIVPPKEFWTPLPKPVPGRRVEGSLPDDHRARFVLRLPREWNGGLVVAAASGITDERTYDIYFSDFALSRGFAFAATDKAVRRCVLDGDTVLMPHSPENSVRRWASRLEALAVLAKREAADFYGRAPERAYAVGLSNGGYIARRAAESSAGHFDAALEISGVLWRADAGNLLRELPAALRASAGPRWDESALALAGYPPAEGRWEPLRAFYKAAYWEASLGLFLGDVDPAYVGPAASYDLDARPASVRETIKSFENTGDLQIPLVSIAGRRDYLIPHGPHAEGYAALVRARGKSALHRLELVDDASHIDTNRDMFSFVEPLMPRAHRAFDELAASVGRGAAAAA